MNRAFLRPDLALISEWIGADATLLDLGCGDGELLAWLTANRQVRGYGLEIDADQINTCIARGVNALQVDIDDGLHDFGDASFDYVVMTQALQALARPDLALAEMLRVGRQAIVTFPNFGHWRVRMALLRGRMPLTPSLPAQWYDTQNIHLCTMGDFEALCTERGWKTLQRALLDRRHHTGWLQKLAPHLFSELAIYRLSAGQ